MGRPYKCPCGSSNNTSKGVRKTKTMGVRRIRLCKDCGKKFTPRNQKANELEGQQVPEAIAEPAAAAAETARPAAAVNEVAVSLQTPEEAIDHQRY
jgi:hypothetical protein